MADGQRNCFRSVLPRLTGSFSDEATQLGAQSPLLVRGFYYEGWHIAHKPTKEGREEFMEHIRHRLPGNSDFDPQKAATASFKVLSQQVSEGEIQDVKNILPKDLRGFWPNGG